MKHHSPLRWFAIKNGSGDGRYSVEPVIYNPLLIAIRSLLLSNSLILSFWALIIAKQL